MSESPKIIDDVLKEYFSESLSITVKTIPSGNGATVIGQVLEANGTEGEAIPYQAGANTEEDVCIALEVVDSTAAAVTVKVLDRVGSVKASGLVWPAGISPAETTTAIAKLLAKDIRAVR